MFQGRTWRPPGSSGWIRVGLAGRQDTDAGITSHYSGVPRVNRSWSVRAAHEDVHSNARVCRRSGNLALDQTTLPVFDPTRTLVKSPYRTTDHFPPALDILIRSRSGDETTM